MRNSEVVGTNWNIYFLIVNFRGVGSYKTQVKCKYVQSRFT